MEKDDMTCGDVASLLVYPLMTISGLYYSFLEFSELFCNGEW
jgi:hypothetical protein